MYGLIIRPGLTEKGKVGRMSFGDVSIKRKLQSRRGVFVVFCVICDIFCEFCLVEMIYFVYLQTEMGVNTIFRLEQVNVKEL